MRRSTMNGSAKALLVLVCALGVAAWTQTPRGTGTYRVLFCEAACNVADSAHALVVGMVVLDTRPERDFGYVSQAHAACFELRTVKPRVTYSLSDGVTTWTVHNDSISFDTYRSPDAGYTIAVVLTPTGFVGKGQSWGAGVAGIDAAPEYVSAERVGEPDLRACRAARWQRRDAILGPVLIGVSAVLGIVVVGLGMRH